jgi:hypothetical protein
MGYFSCGLKASHPVASRQRQGQKMGAEVWALL